MNPIEVIAEYTVPEKILLAASVLETRGETPFTAEALIVCSWKGYPVTFGLKGFADQHPDSNKILASIMGEKGLAKKGWLQKVGQKLYILTEDGRKWCNDSAKENRSPYLDPPSPLRPLLFPRNWKALSN